MKRVSVSSSNLRSVGYDTEAQILEIEFNSGGVCQYFDVPPEACNELMNASSHGKYFHAHIRDVYHYRRVR